MPDTAKLDVRKKLEILQTYLVNGENDSQRRVRRIAENDEVKYFYTEKLFVTGITRKEMEYEIDKNEYDRLIKQVRADYLPVSKTRYCFDYKNQLFELDVYPFSDSLAVMELELDSEEQEIIFPENVDIIKEITGNPAYSNAKIATDRAFPVN